MPSTTRAPDPTATGGATATLAALAGVALGLAVTDARADLAVFVHDQQRDTILRLIDRNGDGDALDPGEATVFFDDTLPITGVDNAQGLVALDERTLLATDNFLLADANDDGDAKDAGESSVFFDGTLPPGFAMTNPAELVRSSDGSLLLLENNFVGGSGQPEAIYRLDDADGSGTIDAGEATLVFELTPAGQTVTAVLSFVERPDGKLLVYDFRDPNDIESIDLCDPATGTKADFFSSSTLFSLTNYLLNGMLEVEWLSDTNELLFGATTLSSAPAFFAARDRNGNDRIDLASELRILWSEAGSADGFSTGFARDFHRASDGSIFWTDALADKVWRLVDANGDGDFQDAGETRIFYDSAAALAAGLPDMPQPLTVTSVAFTACPADLNGDGLADFGDVSLFSSLFAAQDAGADLNGDGILDVGDVADFVAAFNAGC